MKSISENQTYIMKRFIPMKYIYVRTRYGVHKYPEFVEFDLDTYKFVWRTTFWDWLYFKICQEIKFYTPNEKGDNQQ